MALMAQLEAMVASIPWVLILQAAVGVFALTFVWFLFMDRDPSRAIERTIERWFGTAVGIVAATIAGFAAGFEMLAMFPELVISFVGLGAIVAGLSIPMAAVVFVISIVTLDAVAG